MYQRVNMVTDVQVASQQLKYPTHTVEIVKLHLSSKTEIPMSLGTEILKAEHVHNLW